MNVYCHFPFCRRKCAYCALHSRAGSSEAARAAYSRRIANEIRERVNGPIDTVYFGGGTPAMCDLEPVFEALRGKKFAPDYEFTVELHPRDVIEDGELPARLAVGGVNRVSMGFEALDDATLKSIGRAHSVQEAMAAFKVVKEVFPNCGFDLIAGLPRVEGAPRDIDSRRGIFARVLDELVPVHVSVYSLIREPGTMLDMNVRRGSASLPDDDEALDEVAALADELAGAGLARYEISNYSRRGFECRHNLAVWKGEDYMGFGEGAHGREGLVRTVGERTSSSEGDGWSYSRECLSERMDALERDMFLLRTHLGFDPDVFATRHPIFAFRIEALRRELDFDERQGLVRRRGGEYVLTPRGMEVCDAVIAKLLGVLDESNRI